MVRNNPFSMQYAFYQQKEKDLPKINVIWKRILIKEIVWYNWYLRRLTTYRPINPYFNVLCTHVVLVHLLLYFEYQNRSFKLGFLTERERSNILHDLCMLYSCEMLGFARSTERRIWGVQAAASAQPPTTRWWCCCCCFCRTAVVVSFAGRRSAWKTESGFFIERRPSSSSF